ncbi:MAG TPA: hypothetical protein VME41_17540, partial [Stellaceae bacterium]|nr:hypothetical protein [Stellaceae bacterium]
LLASVRCGVAASKRRRKETRSAAIGEFSMVDRWRWSNVPPTTSGRGCNELHRGPSRFMQA